MSSQQQPISGLAEISDDARYMVVAGTSLIMQTLVYGFYLSFFFYAMKISLRRRAVGTMSSIMKYLPICSFVISTAFWAVYVAEYFRRVQERLVDMVPAETRGKSEMVRAVNLFNALALLNFIITDATVLWRSWMICRDFAKSRIPLLGAIGSTVLAFLSAFTSIILRAVVNRCEYLGQACPGPTGALQITEVVVNAFCLLTNMLATGSVGWRFWSLKRSAKKMEHVNDSRKAIHRTFDVLIESGFIYAIISILSLTSVIVTLPIQGTPQLGTFVLPVYVHLSSLYPALVMVIVFQQRSSASSLPTVAPSQRPEKTLSQLEARSGSSEPPEYTLDLTTIGTSTRIDGDTGMETSETGLESVVHLRTETGGSEERYEVIRSPR